MQTNTVIYMARMTPGKVSPQDLVGEWIRIGTGPTTEYVHVLSRVSEGGVKLSDFLPKYDHAQGEPWASFEMREYYENEGGGG